MTDDRRAEHSDDPCVVALYDLFHYISEEFYSAGWIMGLEDRIWLELQRRRNPLEAGHGARLSPLLLAVVDSLSHAAGKWLEWDGEHGAVAIPLGEWMARHPAVDVLPSERGQRQP